MREVADTMVAIAIEGGDEDSVDVVKVSIEGANVSKVFFGVGRSVAGDGILNERGGNVENKVGESVESAVGLAVGICVGALDGISSLCFFAEKFGLKVGSRVSVLGLEILLLGGDVMMIGRKGVMWVA